MNPFKKVWDGLKFTWRQISRPEVMAALQIGVLTIPGLNALGILQFLTWARRAEEFFPEKGTGPHKVQYVLDRVLKMEPILRGWGVPEADWGKYLEFAVLMMKGQAKLTSEFDGKELLEEDLERLASLFENGDAVG